MKKKELLLKAFHEGAIVIIDEINSSSMMERFLNDLLMGKTPEGKRPDKPGFMIFATQNPVTMAGRRVTSKALARRMITTVLPPYTANEMVDILVDRRVEKKSAELLVNIYINKLKEANQGNLTPAPNFRDLLRVADQYSERVRKRQRIKPSQYASEIGEILNETSQVVTESKLDAQHSFPHAKITDKVLHKSFSANSMFHIASSESKKDSKVSVNDAKIVVDDSLKVGKTNS